MKKLTIIPLIATLAVNSAWAQEVEAPENAPKAQPKQRVAVNPFTTIPLCIRVEGAAEVRKPGTEAWVAIEEGKFYPLGCSYRTGENSVLEIAFGTECKAIMSGNSAFGTRIQPLGGNSRTILLDHGELLIKLPDSMPEGAFFVTAPGFTVKSPAGESKYVYSDLGDGFDATVRCVTGTMQVDGRHFAIPRMRAADEFRLRCDRDNLETILYGNSGDYVVQIDRGILAKLEVSDDGIAKEVYEPSKLDWHLSPQTHVQINRAVPAIGEKMSVTVLTFDPAGNLKNNFAFTEGRSEVNTGELIVTEADDAAAKAKKAAEATTEEVAADDEEEASENNNEENNNEENKSEEKVEE